MSRYNNLFPEEFTDFVLTFPFAEVGVARPYLLSKELYIWYNPLRVPSLGEIRQMRKDFKACIADGFSFIAVTTPELEVNNCFAKFFGFTSGETKYGYLHWRT